MLLLTTNEAGEILCLFVCAQTHCLHLAQPSGHVALRTLVAWRKARDW